MAALTDYATKKILDHLLGVSAFVMPTGVYVTIFTDVATLAQLKAGTLTNEIQVSRAVATFPAATLGAGSNSNSVAASFNNLPGGNIGFVGLIDAFTGGNLLTYAPLSPVVVTDIGGGVQISVGNLIATLN